jgi:hypothetical protein
MATQSCPTEGSSPTLSLAQVSETLLGFEGKSIDNSQSDLSVARQTIAIHSELCSHMQLCEPLVVGKLESYAVLSPFPISFFFLTGKESQFGIYRLFTAEEKGCETDAEEQERCSAKLFQLCQENPFLPRPADHGDTWKASEKGSERWGIVHARVSSRMWTASPSFVFSQVSEQADQEGLC